MPINLLPTLDLTNLVTGTPKQAYYDLIEELIDAAVDYGVCDPNVSNVELEKNLELASTKLYNAVSDLYDRKA
jgi:hypothetical protein